MTTGAVPYVLLANGAVAARFLEARPPAAPDRVILNAPAKQRDGDRIRAACAALGVPVAEWSASERESLHHWLGENESRWILSVYFGHLLDAELLGAAGGRAVNVHPALLPWCRGVHTNVWPIVKGCPAGVTMHVMEPRVDGGAILVQREVPVEPWDTAGTLYAKLEDAAVKLLAEHWPDDAVHRWPGEAQRTDGSEHRLRDFKNLERFDADADPAVRSFLNLLRARSFPPHRGLRIVLDGREMDAIIELRPAEGEHP